MNSVPGVEIFRASIFHTPKNPFGEIPALAVFDDGALAVADGRILFCGDYGEAARLYTDAAVRDLRGSFILPGLVDTHVHFPQIRILGGLGYSLLEWLDQITLPEEARMVDASYATAVAGEFVRALAATGTTTAMVFGSHFRGATAALFEAAAARGLRIVSGLVLADRFLLPELHQTLDGAYRDSAALIQNFHRKGRSVYAVTPRFALSNSDAMLDVCSSLLRGTPDVCFTTHINESRQEIDEVARLFPSDRDYLAVYERHELLGARSVLAHNVHASDSELERLAASHTSIAHCPSSNAALGSGIFPLARHLTHGVHCSLGTDVGGGTGFGVMKEALSSYLLQRVASQPTTLTPAMMLYLATLAGAKALGMQDEIGDFTIGKSADFLVIRPPEESILAARLKRTESSDQVLAALFTLARSESIREVRIAGALI